MQMRSGYFVFLSIPSGIYYDDGNVSLADGRKMKIENRDPSTGRVLEPWEIDWGKYPQIPKTPTIRWFRLALAFLFAPILTWFTVECAVWTRSWIKRGFKGEIR
jgi:hypothetical protein